MSNNLKDKLYNYKQSPPADIWEQIISSLETGIQFPEKLHNYQTIPPPHVWNSINASLEGNFKNSKKIIAKSSIIITSLAAAAILFGIVLSAVQLISRKPHPTSVSVISKPVEQKTPIVSNNKNSAHAIAYSPKREPVINRLHRRRHTLKLFFSTSTFSAATKVKDIAPVEDNHLVINTPTLTPVSAASNNHPDLSLADRFMVYTDEAGNHMRLPKKLFSLVHCNTDDYSCKQNLQNLQQKILSASVSADFSGFLDMVKQLQENH